MEKSRPKVLTFESLSGLADYAASIIIRAINTTHNRPLHLGLSGGSTPPAIFRSLENRFAQIERKQLRLFWIDERCKPITSPESNAGSAMHHMPTIWGFSEKYIINGSAEPSSAADAYSNTLADFGGVNALDIALIGVGPDGHVASIFPNSALPAKDTLASATRSSSGQNRITVTYPVLQNCSHQLIVACGESKSAPLAQALTAKPNDTNGLLPLSIACRSHPNRTFLMDWDCFNATNTLIRARGQKKVRATSN